MSPDAAGGADAAALREERHGAVVLLERHRPNARNALSTRLRVGDLEIGLSPTSGLSWLLPRLVGDCLCLAAEVSAEAQTVAHPDARAAVPRPRAGKRLKKPGGGYRSGAAPSVVQMRPDVPAQTEEDP